MKRLVILCMMVIMCGCFLVGCGGDSGKKKIFADDEGEYVEFEEVK